MFILESQSVLLSLGRSPVALNDTLLSSLGATLSWSELREALLPPRSRWFRVFASRFSNFRAETAGGARSRGSRHEFYADETHFRPGSRQPPPADVSSRPRRKRKNIRHDGGRREINADARTYAHLRTFVRSFSSRDVLLGAILGIVFWRLRRGLSPVSRSKKVVARSGSPWLLFVHFSIATAPGRSRVLPMRTNESHERNASQASSGLVRDPPKASGCDECSTILD